MIWQIVLISGCLWGIRKAYYGEELKVSKEFNSILDSTPQRVYNVNGETFSISNFKRHEYGSSFEINIPKGKSYTDLEGLKPLIETNFGYPVEMEQAKGRSVAYCKMIESGFQDKVFEKVETKAHELFLGYDMNGKAIITDQNENPHVLIAGETGTGKSVLMMIMLTNLVLNHSARDINVYITSIAKRDLNDFKYLPQVKGLSKDINEAVAMYREIEGIMNKREELFDNCGVKNIKQYNKKSKSKIPYIYVFADEFSFYQPQKKDADKVQEQKQIALDLLEDFIKRARALGIFIVLGLQVTNADEMPLIIRRQSRTHISFYQKEEIPSKLIIGSDHATTLNPKEAVVMLDYHEYKIKTPEFDTEDINKYINHLIQHEVKEKINEPGILTSFTTETIPSGMTWREYMESKKKKKVDYTQGIGQLPPRRKKGVLKDVDAK